MIIFPTLFKQPCKNRKKMETMLIVHKKILRRTTEVLKAGGNTYKITSFSTVSAVSIFSLRTRRRYI